jgi:hypothetical protein
MCRMRQLPVLSMIIKRSKMVRTSIPYQYQTVLHAAMDMWDPFYR